MPAIGINTYLKTEAHLSDTRLDRIRGAGLDSVTYNNGPEVMKVRNKITYMGGLDRVCDWFFNGNKAEILELIADKVLSEMAQAWQIENRLPDGSLPAVAEAVTTRSAADIQEELEALISPRGWHAIATGNIQRGESGVRFVPDTGDRLANALLAMSFPYHQAKQLLLSWKDDDRLHIVEEWEWAEKQLDSTDPATAATRKPISRLSYSEDENDLDPRKLADWQLARALEHYSNSLP